MRHQPFVLAASMHQPREPLKLSAFQPTYHSLSDSFTSTLDSCESETPQAQDEATTDVWCLTAHLHCSSYPEGLILVASRSPYWGLACFISYIYVYIPCTSVVLQLLPQ